MAQGDDSAAPSEPPLVQPIWKIWASWVAALAVGGFFVVSGVWKLLDPVATTARMAHALIPTQLALTFALGAGITESWAAIMLFVPRWRKWGALLCIILLIVFIAYYGINYSKLRGEDCSCSPLMKEEVGPAFFVRDAVLLLLAAVAGYWARPAGSVRGAAAALAAIAVFAGALYGIHQMRLGTTPAPASLTVDGKPASLKQGRALVFFFDPECAHCNLAAKALARHKWHDVSIYAVATVNPHWGPAFLKATGLQAALTSDPIATLRQSFHFSTDPPFAVAVEDGRQIEKFPIFDEGEPSSSLRRLGWID